MTQTDIIADRLRKAKAEMRRLIACRMDVPESLQASIEHDEALLRMPQHCPDVDEDDLPLRLTDVLLALAVIATAWAIGWVLMG